MNGGSWRIGVTTEVKGEKSLGTTGITVPLTVRESSSATLSYGTASGYMNVEAVIAQGIPAGASHTFDLFDGSVTDVYEDAANFRYVQSFTFRVTSGGDSSGLSLTGGASNPHGLFWTGTAGTSTGQTVYPSGPPASGGGSAGAAVTSTARTLRVTNLGAVEAEYELILVGSISVPGVPMGLLLTLTYP